MTNCTFNYFINHCHLPQVIGKPTREPSSTLLDVILTNSTPPTIQHGVLEPICSDHKPIFLASIFFQIRTHSLKTSLCDFRNTDFTSFRTKLSSIIDTIEDINIISAMCHQN